MMINNLVLSVCRSWRFCSRVHTEAGTLCLESALARLFEDLPWKLILVRRMALERMMTRNSPDDANKIYKPLTWCVHAGQEMAGQRRSARSSGRRRCHLQARRAESALQAAGRWSSKSRFTANFCLKTRMEAKRRAVGTWQVRAVGVVLTAKAATPVVEALQVVQRV